VEEGDSSRSPTGRTSSRFALHRDWGAGDNFSLLVPRRQQHDHCKTCKCQRQNARFYAAIVPPRFQLLRISAGACDSRDTDSYTDTLLPHNALQRLGTLQPWMEFLYSFQCIDFVPQKALSGFFVSNFFLVYIHYYSAHVSKRLDSWCLVDRPVLTKTSQIQVRGTFLGHG
jgi:hypothetical protein